MSDVSLLIVATTAVLIALGVVVWSLWKNKQIQQGLLKKEKDMQRRMYELAILKELGERVGYSLDLKQIVDIIMGSLHQFIEYSATSYMLIEPEKILFKVHLEESVSREFLDEIRDRMLKSLSALLDRDFNKEYVDEVLTGAILVDELPRPVQSFFNIPLVIGDKVVGVLTVAHTQDGLYKEEEMTILYKITQQASQAVTRLQEVIEIEQRKLNAMVLSMTEGVVMTDKDYRVVVANPAIRKAVGIPEDKEEITVFDFIDRLDGKFDIRGKLEESVKLDKVLVTQEVLIHDRYWQIFVAPVKGSAGLEDEVVMGGVVIFHDITHEKEVVKMRDDFTSMMVHELRSPLDGIRKLSELLQQDSVHSDEKTYTEFSQIIHRSSSEMLELVNDLLDVAKLEAGKFDINPEPANMKTTIESRISFYKTQAEGKKIALSAHIDEKIPQSTMFDPSRMNQVLNNLLSNSLKFTPEGGSVYVQAFTHAAGADIVKESVALGIEWFVKDNTAFTSLSDCLVVAVTDSGMGIPQEKIKQLFNKFKQLGSSERVPGESKGTGLGLVIAKGLVEAHRGTIGVASDEGKGSTFYFTVPLNS